MNEDIPVVSPVMAGTATLATNENLGSTLGALSLASGVGAIRGFFSGAPAAGMANASSVLGFGNDVVTSNDYTTEKLGLEAMSRVPLRFGPADDMGYRIHSGLNQRNTTWSGFLIGREEN